MSLGQTVRSQGEAITQVKQSLIRIEQALKEQVGVDVSKPLDQPSNLEKLILKLKAFTKSFAIAETARKELIQFGLDTKLTGEDLKFVATKIGLVFLITREKKEINLLHFSSLSQPELAALDKGLSTLDLKTYERISQVISDDEKDKIKESIKLAFTREIVQKIANQAIEQFKESKLAPIPIRPKIPHTPPPASSKSKDSKNQKKKSKSKKTTKDNESKEELKNQNVNIHIDFEEPKHTSVSSSSSSSSTTSQSNSTSPIPFSSPSPRAPSPRQSLEKKLRIDEDKDQTKNKRKSIDHSYSTYVDMNIERILRETGSPIQSAAIADKEKQTKMQQMLPSDISDEARETPY